MMNEPGLAAGANGGPARGAEQAGHRPLQIAAREGRRCALGEAEAVVRHDHDGVGIATGEILALAAMALQLTLRGVVRNVANLAAITAAFDGHLQSPGVCPGLSFPAQFQNTSLKRRKSISKLQRGPGEAAMHAAPLGVAGERQGSPVVRACAPHRWPFQSSPSYCRLSWCAWSLGAGPGFAQGRHHECRRKAVKLFWIFLQVLGDDKNDLAELDVVGDAPEHTIE
jgi:hypothetical protein